MCHLAKAMMAVLVGFVAVAFSACTDKCKTRTCAEVGDAYCGTTSDGCGGELICRCSLSETDRGV